MSERPWYKRYGGDFVVGSMRLTLEEKGAYSLCLDLIYDRAGPIPDDARWLAGICGVSVRKWTGLRANLIKAGKLFEEDGFLMNRRAIKELENAAKISRKLAENGSKGGNKSAETRSAHNKNNDLDEARLKPYQSPEARDQIPEKKEPEEPDSILKDSVQLQDLGIFVPLEGKGTAKPAPPKSQSRKGDLDQAVKAYNIVAKGLGWGVCAQLTKTRASKLQARIVDAGGMDGWFVAMERASQSPFLRGEGERSEGHENWRPTIDFFITESSFVKLVEGKYDALPDGKNGDVPRSANGKAQYERTEWLRAYSLDGRWQKNTSGNGIWKDPYGVGAPPHDPRTLVTENDFDEVPKAREMRAKMMMKVAAGTA